MRRFWVVAFAPLLLPSPALAQDGAPESEPWQYSPVRSPSSPPPSSSSRSERGILLAGDLSAALPIRSPSTKTAGDGGDFRIGYRIPLGPVWLAPEGTLGWVGFPQYDFAMRAGLGAQLGINGEVVEPSVYAFGGAFVEFPFFAKAGPGARAGGSLDFRPGRSVLVGIHVDYNRATWDTNSVSYVGCGLHVGALLDALAPRK